MKILHKNHRAIINWRAFFLACLCWTVSSSVWAQEPNTPTSEKTPATSGQKDSTKASDAQSDSSNAQPSSSLGGVWASSYFHQIGAAGLLGGSPQGLHWGRFYVPSADVRGVVESIKPPAGQPSDILIRTLFTGIVVYDRQFSRNRFALQYRPRLALADGKVVKDFSNQSASIDLLVYSRPQWSVRAGDSFEYSYTQHSAADLYFDVDSITSSTLSTTFLDGSNKWIGDSAYVAVAYALSPRSSIVVTPKYSYVQSTRITDTRRAHEYGGDVGWSYRTSARQAITVEYFARDIHETTGAAGDTLYHTIAGGLERQLSSTWSLKGSGGVTIGNAGSGSRNLDGYGTFGLVKNFNRSSFALNYYRADSFSNGLFSTQFSDRVDLIFRTQLTQRVTWGIAGGYLREVLSGGFQAKYGRSDISFLLAPRAGLYAFFGFVRKNQGGNSPGLFVGTTDLYSFGLRWQPSHL